MINDHSYYFLNCGKYRRDFISNIYVLGDLFIPIKVFKENSYNSKLLYGIIKKMREYSCEPSNFKLNIIKDLLSRVTLFSYDYDFYSHFCEILTRSHCDLKLFEATKLFIFRLYIRLVFILKKIILILIDFSYLLKKVNIIVVLHPPKLPCLLPSLTVISI